MCKSGVACGGIFMLNFMKIRLLLDVNKHENLVRVNLYSFL
jgi:hypothetical protein